MKFKSNVEVQAKVFIGDLDSANSTRFPNALSVTSIIPLGVQHNESLYIGLMSEALSVGSTWASGVYGAGYTNASGSGRGTGVTGEGHVSSASDTGVAVGVRGYAKDIHSGNYNIGLYGDAENGDSGLTYGGNVSLFLANGNIVTSSAAAKSWYLGGDLTFNGQGSVKTISVTNGAVFALGTPSSGVLTYCTGLPNGGLVNSSITINGTSVSLGGSITVGNATASGTTNYVPKFTGATSLGNSQIFDNGTNVGIGTTSPLQKLHVEGLSYFASDIFTLNNGGIFFSGNNSYQRGIYSNSSGLTLQTLGSPKVTITDGGNVGIGTTSPYSKLDVTDYTAYLSLSSGINSEATSPNQQIGGIDFRKHYGLAIGTSIRQLQSGGVNNYSYAHLAFYTNNGEVAFGSVPPERMRITSEGNVGIGTTSPSAKLESYKGSQSDVISRANASAYFWGADIGLAIGQSQSGPFGTWIQSLKHDNNATFPLSLNPNGGNVGVGTVNPQRKLEVKGSHTTATFRVYYPDENVAGQDASVDIWASEPGISFNGSGIGSNVNGQPYYGRTNPALGQGFIRFIDGTTAFHNSSGDAAYSERMRITPGGRVGVGITNPDYKFQVYDTSDGIVGHFGGGLSNYTLISFKSNEANVYSTSLGSYNSGMLFRTGATDRMYINSSGKVGIGTSAPNDVLSVQSNVFTSIGIYDTYNDSQVRNWAFRNSAFGSAGFGGIGLFQSNTQNGDPNSGTARFGIDKDGNVGIGTTSPEECALLHVDTREKGFLPPRMDTGQRDNIASPVEGLIIWNYDTRTIEVYDGSNWQRVAFI